jgi:mRNA-degrading endonuclease toxin of MazEF toxin-antitoxin module
MADQMTTISKSRLLRRLGQRSTEDVEAIGQVVRLQLGL